MDLTSISNLKSLARKYKFWPKRLRGQNFLISKLVLKKIIRTAQLERNDKILEVGPGFGVLTQELVKRAKKVWAIESDPKMVKFLQEMLGDFSNLEIIEGDIFKRFSDLKSFLKNFSYKLVSNLPYNITSLVLRNFLSQKPKPSQLILLVQKEVAERIVARPGQMSLLSVAIQFYGKPQIISLVSKKNFWPQPKVDSALIKIDTLRDKELPSLNQELFFKIVKAGFSSRRKKLSNSLARSLGIKKEEIEEILIKIHLPLKIRSQELTLQDWQNLALRLRPV